MVLGLLDYVSRKLKFFSFESFLETKNVKES
jgi:hypothetical protein